MTHLPSGATAPVALAGRIAGSAPRHVDAAPERMDRDRGGRPTVVLLHSSANSARQWEALAKMLEPAFRVRAVEFHGHGARPPWSGGRPLTLADDAALVLPLLPETGGVHVVGHSYGGAVALMLATMAPQRIRSLVAYEPVLFSWLINDDPQGALAEDVVRWGAAIGRCLEQGDEAGAARCFVDFWSGDGAWSRMTERQQRSVAGRMRAVHAHFAALCAGPPRPDDVARLALPMMFLSGAGTAEATRRIAALLRQALPSAEHQQLDAMGHLGPITHAEAVNLRIAWFLMSRGSETSATPAPAGAAADVAALRRRHLGDDASRAQVGPETRGRSASWPGRSSVESLCRSGDFREAARDSSMA